MKSSTETLALSGLRRHGTLVALGLLLVFNAAFTPNFLQLQTLFVNISQVATIAIVAIGMTLVIATKGIDLSVGAVIALTVVVVAWVLDFHYQAGGSALLRFTLGHWPG